MRTCSQADKAEFHLSFNYIYSHRIFRVWRCSRGVGNTLTHQQHGDNGQHSDPEHGSLSVIYNTVTGEQLAGTHKSFNITAVIVE